MSTICVVGAGIVGSLAARELQKAGHQVTLIDRDEPGNGCSYGNACLISPDAVVPFLIPASMRNLFRWLTDPTSPLSIRWRDLPATAPWLLQALAAARSETALKTGRGMADLHRGSLEAYRTLLDEIGRPDLLASTGQLQVSKRENALLPDVITRQLREEAAIESHAIGADELHRMVPALCRSYKSGLFFPRNGHTLSSMGLVSAIVSDFIARGGTLAKQVVQQFETTPAGAVSGVRTATGMIKAERVVLAAGIASKDLLRRHGIRVSLQAERGYHLMLPAPGLDIPLPMSNRDHGFAVTPVLDGVRLAGTIEFARPTSQPDWRRADILGEHAQRMFPDLSLEGKKRWMGSRPSFPDGLPMIGPCPTIPGLTLAFGNGHFGMTAAPEMARRICAF